MSFTSDIDRFITEVQRNSDQIFKDSVTTLYTNIVNMSPVDTGRFKSSWVLDIKPDTAEIYNPVDYGIYLEYGHSKQAPKGMVRLNVQKWNQIVQTHINKYK